MAGKQSRWTRIVLAALAAGLFTGFSAASGDAPLASLRDLPWREIALLALPIAGIAIRRVTGW